MSTTQTTFEDELRNVMDGNDDYYTVVDWTAENVKTAEDAKQANDMADTAREFGSDDVEIIGPGENTDYIVDLSDGDADGSSGEETDAPEPEIIETETVDPETPDDLPDRSVADDPIEWLERAGGDFVDWIDGSAAINRKGFEVLSHFYDVDVASDCVTAPEDTDFTYCRCKATATTADGRTCEAHGSAHFDRGDDPSTLLEYADTRARKRALSIATGVGAVAVEELQAEVRE